MLYVYAVTFSTYYYNYNMSIEKAKQTGYVTVRNGIGVLFFMLVIFVSVLFKFTFDLKFRMSNYRIPLYIVNLILILSYLKFSKIYMQPMFDSIELDEKYKGNNSPHILIIICLLLYVVVVFVAARFVGRLF
jgi:hypothetical protein